MTDLTSRLQLLKFFHRSLQLPRDLLGIDIPLEAYRPAHTHPNFPRRGKSSACLFDFPQPIDPHGYNGNTEILRQQPNSCAKRIYVSIHRMTPFRKNQHAVAAIHRLSGIGKTLAEPVSTWKRKQIEQRNSESPFHPVVNSSQHSCIGGRRAQGFERLAARSCNQPMPETYRQSGLYESHVYTSNMI